MNIHNPEMAGKRAPPPWEHDLAAVWAKHRTIVETEPGISFTEKAQTLDLALTVFVVSALAPLNPMQKSDFLKTLNTLL